MSVSKVVYKRTDGKRTVRYRADVYKGGVKLLSKCFETKAKAHTWHDEMRAYVVTSKSPIWLGVTNSFSECLGKFMKHERGFLRMRRSTQQSFQLRLRHLIDAPIAYERMDDFTEKSIDRWIAWLVRQPSAGSIKRTSFRSELKIMHRILNWYRNYVDSRFVVPIVDRHREDVFFKPFKKRRRDFFIREDDIRPWIEWLKINCDDPVFGRLASFMVLTGTRLGEACGMRWDAIDLERGEAQITRVVAWDLKTRQPYLEELTKTDESDRLIQLPGKLVDRLKEFKPEVSAKGLVFVDRDGQTPTDNKIRKEFNRGFKALNLPWTSTRILRHTWGTLARVATQDLNKVQANLGHTDIRTTQIYAKVAAMMDKSVVEQTSDLMGF